MRRFSSFLARKAGLEKREVQALVPIGAAAALAAAFNTPMAAVLFTLEQLLGGQRALESFSKRNIGCV